ncbi:MAG: ComF family protein [Saprospiraceae bacterium]|nr:ComF family protein [Saprospiraceae bacterium]MBP6522789.1 ComF family protein [Saprospiraceae bacterium]
MIFTPRSYKRLKEKLAYAGEALLELFYPNLCMVCGANSYSKEELFCIRCQSITSPTQQHLHLENEFTGHFKGRIKIQTGASLYYYVPDGLVHKILELIKYRNQPELAEGLGHYYGKMLCEIPCYHDTDIVIPVPLHPKREIHRGYNQSFLFGRALANELGAAIFSDVLIRIHHTTSQTEKDRFSRNENMKNVFKLSKPEIIKDKNILLVDDVLTTGATLESCAIELEKGFPKTINMATIAIGR